jgi:hypothetical protein
MSRTGKAVGRVTRAVVTTDGKNYLERARNAEKETHLHIKEDGTATYFVHHHHHRSHTNVIQLLRSRMHARTHTRDTNAQSRCQKSCLFNGSDGL